MIDKKTFCDFIDSLESYVAGMEQLEQTLKVMFDNNFLTHHLDNSLDILSNSFFTEEELADSDQQVTVNTVRDLIYHFTFQGEFGLKKSELQRLYVEDEGLETEFILNAFTAEELYDIIIRYIHPPRVYKTCLLGC